MQGTGRRSCVSGCTLLFSHVSLYFWPMFSSGSMLWGRSACLSTLQADTSMGHSLVLAASLCLRCQGFPAPAALALAHCTSWRHRTLIGFQQEASMLLGSMSRERAALEKPSDAAHLPEGCPQPAATGVASGQEL